MDFDYQKEKKLLVIQLKEDVDHHVAEKIRRRMDNEIQRYMPKKVILDFTKVNFMDSSGIGLIIGRYKMASMLGGKVQIKKVAPAVRRILEMSGILKIIPIINEEEENEESVWKWNEARIFK